MRVSGVVALVGLLVAGCGGSPTNTATHSPRSSATATATASVTASTTTTPSPIPSGTAGPASAVHCATAVPAGDNLVIGTVVGDPTIVVRDIQDPANAKNLCTLDANVIAPQFVSASVVAYETPDGHLIEAPLSGGVTTLVATYTPGFFSGAYAVSPDGKSITYLDGSQWRLVGPSGNRLLSTLPAAPNRGLVANQDDLYLSFSPDGQYIALFQTFHVGGSGETAPDQIRNAGDGKLVYSTSGMTMAVWASVPSRLYFRDQAGGMHRWDPSTGLSAMTTLSWIRPRSSPDGRWIAYTFPASGGVDGVGFYSVQANAVQNTTPPGRSNVVFLTNDLVWYIGEKPCSTCFGGQPAPTGVTYIYSIAGASEITSRLASAIDAWPKVTAPGL